MRLLPPIGQVWACDTAFRLIAPVQLFFVSRIAHTYSRIPTRALTAVLSPNWSG